MNPNNDLDRQRAILPHHRAAGQGNRGLPNTTQRPRNGSARQQNTGMIAHKRSLPDAERTTVIDKYALRAVALLRESQKLGYFKDATHVAHMKKDTELDALHERADFKQFLKELEASATDPDEHATDE